MQPRSRSRLAAALNPWVKPMLARLMAALAFLHRAGVDKDIRGVGRFGARMVRVLLLAGMSFTSNQIPVRASALTYTAILAFVPFIVIMSSVAGEFGYLGLLSRLVISFNDSMNLDLNLDPILGVIEYAQKIDFQKLGFVGSLALLFTFFLSMSNIELAMDHIWGIKTERAWWKRIILYTPFLILLIILLVAAINMMLKYRGFLDSRMAGSQVSVIVHDTMLVIGLLGTIAFIWLGMWLMYYLLPNTKVRFFPAALGATIATIGAFGLSRVLLLFPTLFVSRNNYIYGSLAALPVLLLIIYIFWVIVLFGAAVAFIYQRLYHPLDRAEEAAEATSPAFHSMEAMVISTLRAVHDLSGSREMEGRSIVTLDVLSRHMGLEQSKTEILAYPLVELGLLARKKTAVGPVYRPRGHLEQVDLTAVHSLLLRLDPEGTGELRALTAWDEIKHTLGVLYSIGQRKTPLYLAAAMDDPQGRKP